MFLSREKALQEGLKSAVQVPLNVIKTAAKAWDPMVELAKIGNINSKSDLQVQRTRFAVKVWYTGKLVNRLKGRFQSGGEVSSSSRDLLAFYH